VRVNSILAPAVVVALCVLTAPHVSGQQDKAKAPAKKGVPLPVAKKAPPPPAGATPHTPEGTVDFGGVWVLSGSTNLPSDPSYLPWAKKIYD